MTQENSLRAIQNSIDFAQSRLKAANGFAQRSSLVSCQAELKAVIRELQRAEAGCARLAEEALPNDRQLELFRQAGAL